MYSMDEAVVLILKDMGYTGSNPTIEYIDSAYVTRRPGMYSSLVGDYTVDYNHIRVATKLPYEQVMDTLAHELRHAWQWQTGVLQNTNDYYRWKGTRFYTRKKVWKRCVYEQRPQEIDARAYARYAWVRLFKGNPLVDPYRNPAKVFFFRATYSS